MWGSRARSIREAVQHTALHTTEPSPPNRIHARLEGVRNGLIGPPLGTAQQNVGTSDDASGALASGDDLAQHVPLFPGQADAVFVRHAPKVTMQIFLVKPLVLASQLG